MQVDDIAGKPGVSGFALSVLGSGLWVLGSYADSFSLNRRLIRLTRRPQPMNPIRLTQSPEPNAQSPFSPSLQQQLCRDEHKENDRDDAIHSKERGIEFGEVAGRDERVLVCE